MAKKVAKKALEEIGLTFTGPSMYGPKDLVLVDNPRHVLYQDRVKLPVDQSLVQSMKDNGFLSQIIVADEYEEEGFEKVKGQRKLLGTVVVVGRQRVKAAREAGVKEVPALNIGDLSLVSKSALLRLMVEENELRQDNNTLEKAHEAQRLYDAKLQEQKPKDWPEEIAWKPSKDNRKLALDFTAGCFGISSAWLTRMLKLLDEETSPELISAIKKDEISFRAAIQLAGMTAKEQEQVLKKLEPVRKAKEAASGGKQKSISVKEVDAVTAKKAKVTFDRDIIIKISKRRSTPADVKEFCKYLLDPEAVDLPYLPGRLEPIGKTNSRVEEPELEEEDFSNDEFDELDRE